MPCCRQSKLHGLVRRLRSSGAVHLPARLQHDDRSAEREREADLGQRAVAASHRDHGVSRSDDGKVAAVSDSRHDDVVEPLVPLRARLAGKDSDRRAAGAISSACRRGHDLAEPAGYDRRPALGEQTPHLLGALLVLQTAADHGDLHHGAERRRA